MKAMQIKKADLPRLGSYQLAVILDGHEPGVLSGASLKGKAKQWGGKYARSRAAVVRLMGQYGVFEGYSRNARTRNVPFKAWVDAEGNPVRIELV